MADAEDEAQKAIRHALCAALFARPRSPGLSRDELRELALRAGAGPGALDEVLRRDWMHMQRDGHDRAIPIMRHCQLAYDGMHQVPDILPVTAIRELSKALDELDRELGERHPKQLSRLRSQCRCPEAEFELNVGIAVTMGWLREEQGGYVRKGDLFAYDSAPRIQMPHPDVEPVRKLIPHAQAMFAKRVGQVVAESPPLDRFHAFLKRQGWDDFARWWSMTHGELESLGPERHPTAVCVLCGALLEAALVAVARPARSAGQWKQRFLKEKPANEWKLGELIEQAASAQTFTPAQQAHARMLMDCRNRIHAGRYASAEGTFSPPYAETHQAELARLHLPQLLAALLAWPPIAELDERGDGTG